MPKLPEFLLAKRAYAYDFGIVSRAERRGFACNNVRVRVHFYEY